MKKYEIYCYNQSKARPYKGISGIAYGLGHLCYASDYSDYLVETFDSADAAFAKYGEELKTAEISLTPSRVIETGYHLEELTWDEEDEEWSFADNPLAYSSLPEVFEHDGVRYYIYSGSCSWQRIEEEDEEEEDEEEEEE